MKEPYEESGRVPDQPPPYYESSGQDKEKVPISRKVALAMGAAPLVLPIVTATVYIQLFLLEVSLISPKGVSVVLFLGRAFDAITDPLIGFLVNLTQSKGNTLRMWMMSALPFLICSYFFMWQVPDFSENVLIGYYTTIYIVLQVAFTVYSVPYSALIMYQTNDQKERDVTTAFRMTAEIIFGVLAVGIMGAIIGGSLSNDGFCSDDTGKDAAWRENTMRMYTVSSIVMVGMVIVAGIITYCGTQERSDITIQGKEGSAFMAAKRVMTHKPYVYLMLAYFCMFLSVAIVQGNLQLYFKYSISHVENFSTAMGLLMLCAGLGVPLWQVALSKFGKKKTAYIGASIIVPALSSLMFIPANLNIYIIYAFCCVAGIGIGSGYFLPWSMLPDVVDNYTVENEERNESIFYGFFVFFNKFAAGLGLGISAIFLELAGYDNDACAQPDNVDFTLRLLCAPGPAFLVLLYCFFVYMYPITEEVCLKNKAILKEKIARERQSKELDAYINGTLVFAHEYITYM